MTSQSPVVPLINWVQELPTEVKGDLLFLAFHSLSRVVADLGDCMSEDVEDHLVSWLESGDNHHVVASKVLIARAHISYVMSQRGTQESWNKAREINQSMLQEFQGKPGAEGMVKTVEANLANMPLREQLWLSANQSWNLLSCGVLSDASISNWSLLQVGRDQYIQ